MEEFRDLGLVVLAMVLGGFVGFERERAHKPAGLRTHMLVSGASCLFVLLSFAVTNRMVRVGTEESVSADPTRVILAIVTGISFIGAGTVIRHSSSGDEGSIVGLTTAASLLMAAAVGTAVALEEYVLAVGAVVLSVAAMWGLVGVEQRIRRRG